MRLSNNWKKRVSDFFFDEIEIEVEEEVSEQNNNPVYRTYPTSNKAVNTKVAYQYPKKNQAPFRFPVIPDARMNDDTEVVHPVKQQSKKRSRKPQRPHRENDTLKLGYQHKKLSKELENVPAYIRRQRAREQLQEREPVEKMDAQLEEEQKEELIEHTRPDELDRVFRIRDGLSTSHHIEVEQADIDISKLNSIQARHIRKAKLDEIRRRIDAEKSQANDKQEAAPKYDQVDDYDVRENDIEVVEEESKSKEEKAATLLEVDEMSVSQMLGVYNAAPIEKANREEPKREIKSVPDYLLNDPLEPSHDDEAWVKEQQHLLNQTLEHFKVDAKVVNVTKGPAVTRFEIQPALGVKVSRIRTLSDDIKLNLAARDIRMEAPIPGKNTIGIEVPNLYPQMVSLQEIIETNDFKQSPSDLTIALGLTIEGEPLITTIDKMPHGLIAGATGSGKSVCINSIILSLLYKANHEDVKFMMIDPKMVELTPYNGIPHLISPVITDAKAATIALKWAVEEMESRYEKFAEAGVRNLDRYNTKMVKEQRMDEKLPYMVIIIDELADLMIVSPQEVEDAICRIAQKARACGMHLLLATQRPSVDVITGLIKANIPTRVAFSVSSQVDSRTILDANGAEKLLGKGDMLFVENGASKSVRLQGPFVSDDEIDRVANYARSIAEPTYLFEQEQLLLEVENEDEDELLSEVITFVVDHGQASTSLLQRRFRIGYNRAARLIDSLEQKGIVSAANGSKPREILVTPTQIDDAF